MERTRELVLGREERGEEAAVRRQEDPMRVLLRNKGEARLGKNGGEGQGARSSGARTIDFRYDWMSVNEGSFRRFFRLSGRRLEYCQVARQRSTERGESSIEAVSRSSSYVQ